jgi:FtsZ-binding cell division protein ZapB
MDIDIKKEKEEITKEIDEARNNLAQLQQAGQQLINYIVGREDRLRFLEELDTRTDGKEEVKDGI